MTRWQLSRSRRAQVSILIALLALAATSLIYLHRAGDLNVARSANQHPILASAQFASADVGWLLLRDPATSAGELVTTSDSGESWHRLAPPLDALADVLGFQLIDRRYATLQLGHGLRMTQDAGATWHEVILPDGAKPSSGAYFIDGLRGWYLSVSHPDGIGRPTSMWSTGDGGATWVPLFSVTSTSGAQHGVPLEGDKVLLGFSTPDDGWLDVVSIASSRLLATHDGGETWKPVELPVDAPVVAMRYFSSRDILLVLAGTPGYVVVTSADAGASWSGPREVPVAGLNFGIRSRPAFLDPNTWLLPAGRQIEVTQDRGETWSTLTPLIPSGLQLEDLPWVSQSGQGFGVARDGLDNPYLLVTGDGGRHWAQTSIPQLG
jgi:photosystem II stability/assembly factor-like uncharacterized protein